MHSLSSVFEEVFDHGEYLDYQGRSKAQKALSVQRRRYLLELIVIHAAEQLKSQKPSMIDMINHVLEIFANFDSIKVRAP